MEQDILYSIKVTSHLGYLVQVHVARSERVPLCAARRQQTFDGSGKTLQCKRACGIEYFLGSFVASRAVASELC